MLTRDEMRAYMAAKRAEWRAQGKCPTCGYERDDERWTCCSRCREMSRARVKRMKDRRKADGSN